jgi:hypothetical protein
MVTSTLRNRKLRAKGLRSTINEYLRLAPRPQLPQPEAEAGAFLDAQFEAGCDDASVSIACRGVVRLGLQPGGYGHRGRDEMGDFRRAEGHPSLVNLADLADGRCRQNARQQSTGELRNSTRRCLSRSSRARRARGASRRSRTWLKRHSDLQPSAELIETAVPRADHARYGRLRSALGIPEGIVAGS